jgi:YggT family protein
MFVLSNLISAIAVVLEYVLTTLSWLVIIRALISWVSPDPFNPIVRFLYAVTEPVLSPFRRVIPIHNIGIDISPVLALIFIWFVKLFLVNTLFGLAARI